MKCPKCDDNMLIQRVCERCGERVETGELDAANKAISEKDAVVDWLIVKWASSIDCHICPVYSSNLCEYMSAVCLDRLKSESTRRTKGTP